MTTRTAIRAVVLVVVVVAVASSQFVSRTAASGQGGGIQFAPRTNSEAARSIPGPPSRILDVILRQIGNVPIDVRLGPVGPGASLTERELPSDSGTPVPGVALHVAFPAPSGGGDVIRETWLAHLIGGALNDRMVALNLGPLRTVELLWTYPDGSVASSGSGFGRVEPAQEFDDPPQAERIRAAGKRFGRVALVRYLRASFQASPEVTLVVDDAEAFVRSLDENTFVQHMVGDTSRLEGFLIDVRSSTGQPVLKLGGAARAGLGLRWISPDLDPDYPGSIRELRDSP